MKSPQFLLIIFTLFSVSVFSQVGINTTTPEPSAEFEIFSTDKGFLPPKMSIDQRDDITSSNPNISQGLIIYNTTLNCLQINNSTDSTIPNWVSIQKPGTTIGEMQYWNGLQWTTIAPVTGYGATLQINNGIISWIGALESTIPSAPTITSVTSNNGSVTITFTEGLSDGGSPITAYTVTSSDEHSVTSNSSSDRTLVVSNLTNGTPYTFTITATNSNGTSADSAPSESVTPARVPYAPTDIVAIAGNEQAIISFQAPSDNGGSVITRYTAISNSGAHSNYIEQEGSGQITVTGLTNGVGYTFHVIATNSVGEGSSSIDSNVVTPTQSSTSPTDIVYNFDSDVEGWTNIYNTSVSQSTDYLTVSNIANYGGTISPLLSISDVSYDQIEIKIQNNTILTSFQILNYVVGSTDTQTTSRVNFEIPISSSNGEFSIHTIDLPATPSANNGIISRLGLRVKGTPSEGDTFLVDYIKLKVAN